MSKLRIKFSKLGMGKYISHLDLLRTFTRAIHRANLPVRYSQGFNPHQLITFSLPLALGVTSETEFVDIDFEEGTSKDLVMTALNGSLPPDIKVLKVSIPECKANDIVSARYIIELTAKETIEEDAIKKFFAQENIAAMKKTKKGEKEINLRDYIVDWKISEISDHKISIDAILSAGGTANIKPEILVAKMEEFLQIGEFDEVSIHRTEIFYSNGKEIKTFC